MLANKFTTIFSNKRMIWYEENSELEDYMSFKGHIQQTNPELSESLGLSFTKSFTVWCPLSTDVIVGDELSSGDNEYLVRAIKDFKIGNNQHKQLFIERTEDFSKII